MTDASQRVLVVEDDADISYAVAAMLRSEGYDVDTAGNGLVALERIGKDGPPDLVLLDMKMPVMNGWEFAAEFRRRHGAASRILVITAAQNAEQRAKDIAAGGWLAKPFSAEELLAAVRRACGNGETHDE